MSDNNGNGKKSITEMFRWFTPILVTISIFYLGGINATVQKIDDKLFRHLTNDEIHTPKSVVVSKAEFEIYQTMRDRQMSTLVESLCRIEKKLDEHTIRSR